MGALTLKTYPFELRGWEVQKFKSFDPTDNFICVTSIYLNKNNIVQIEPIYDSCIYKNNWLNDKARFFFDAFFYTNVDKTKYDWLKLYYKILIKIYIFEHCNRQTNQNYFFTVVFDYLNIELLGLLIILSKIYSFINLKQAQPFINVDVDCESNFQMNSLVNQKIITNSSLCLLINTNPRYEGNILNLNLRQRIFKLKFKCILIGSVINLIFPVFYFGTSVNIIKTITEGNNFICQNIKYSTNPVLIHNTDLFKRTDNKSLKTVLHMLFFFKHFNQTWCGHNILSSSINETGTFLLNQTTKLKLKNLNNFSLIYFINTNINFVGNIKKIIELYLFQQDFKNKNLSFSIKKLILDQNYNKNNNFQFFNQIIVNYLYVPASIFYENTGTFINTEGFFKKKTKIIAKNKIKSNWYILRKIINYLKIKLVGFNNKDKQNIFFNLKKFYNFKNYINFNFGPIKKLTHLSCLLSTKNKVFIFNFKTYFKTAVTKIKNTKLKYCLNDFFNGGKDAYSFNSVLLINCSKQAKFQTTNFF